MGLAVLILGFALIAGAAWLAAATLRLRSPLDFLLAVYLFATGGVILIVLALSPFSLFTRGGVLVASAVFLAAAGAVWQLRGRPAIPSMRAAAATAGAALRDPLLMILAIAVSIALAYAAALAIATPPNDYDLLWYHLPRAAIWVQEQSVHYIEHANTTRLNENPPGAEILSAWTMALEGSDRYASIFQVIGLAATILAIARIARLLGFDHRQAIFGALLFPTLPVVALQATTAGNDLVMTSYVVTVVAFMLNDTRATLGLGAFALALSVLTKGTALFAIPMLLVVAVILVPYRRWWPVGIAGALSIAAAGLWYVFHRAEAGGAGEEQSNVLERGRQPLKVPLYMARMAIDAVDPAGSAGRDRYTYAIAAAVLLVLAGVAAYRGRSRTATLAALGGIALVLIPAALPTVHDTLLRGYQSVLVGHVDERLVFLGYSRDPTIPAPFDSWYGPLGLIAFVLATVFVIRAVRHGNLRKGMLVLTLAPLVTLVIVTTLWSYSPWHGRFFMPAVALSAATWGVLHRVRAVAVALSVIAVVTVTLSFLHYRQKPAGISVLDGTTSRSVWTQTRDSILTYSARGGGSPEVTVLRRLWDLARDGETVAVRIRGDNVSYQYFDPGGERRVVYVDDEGGLDADADWLVAAPELTVDVCPAGWRQEVATEGWRLYRRIGLCPGESASS